jgi:hypothetical protein
MMAKGTIRLELDAACATPSGSNKQTHVKQPLTAPFYITHCRVCRFGKGKKCRILPLFEIVVFDGENSGVPCLLDSAVYKAIILLRFSCVKHRLGIRTVDLDLHQGLFALPALGAGRAARGDEHRLAGTGDDAGECQRVFGVCAQ